MRAWPVMVVAVFVAVGGCSGPDGVDPLARYGDDVGYVGLDALLPDAVVELSEGCLTLRTVDGASVVPVFRDRDVTWGEGVLEFRGERYEVGDTLTVGGGYSGTVVTGSADVLTPKSCDPDAAIWLVGDFGPYDDDVGAPHYG